MKTHSSSWRLEDTICNEEACNQAIRGYYKRSGRHIVETQNLFPMSRKIYGADLRREYSARSLLRGGRSVYADERTMTGFAEGPCSSS